MDIHFKFILNINNTNNAGIIERYYNNYLIKRRVSNDR